MMTHKFSKRASFWLVAAIIVLIGIIYYMVVYMPTARTIADAQSQLESMKIQITAQQQISADIARMKSELGDVDSQGGSPVLTPEYDNANNVMTELNSALANSINHKLTFGQVKFEDGFALRPITVSFEAESYADARQIILSLYEGAYQCSISTLSISSHDLTRSNPAEPDYKNVSVSLVITYYELVTD